MRLDVENGVVSSDVNRTLIEIKISVKYESAFYSLFTITSEIWILHYYAILQKNKVNQEEIKNMETSWMKRTFALN